MSNDFSMSEGTLERLPPQSIEAEQAGSRLAYGYGRRHYARRRRSPARVLLQKGSPGHLCSDDGLV